MSSLILAPAAYILAVMYSRPFAFDGYYFTRWVEPPALVLSAAACTGLALAWSWARDPIRELTTSSALGFVGIFLLVVSLPHFVRAMAAQRYHLVNDSRAIHLMNVRAGEWIRDHTAPDAVVAANDAGAIRFIGQRKTLDLIGLNDAEIAFSGDRNAAVAKADWVAIFPSWFEGSDFLKALQPVQVISIAPGEYTLSGPATGQSKIVIYRHGGVS